MASTIDVTQPPAINPTTAGLRSNMAVTKSELEKVETALSLCLVGFANMTLTANKAGMLNAGFVPWDFAEPGSYANAASVSANMILIPNDIDFVRVITRTEWLYGATFDGTTRGHTTNMSVLGNPVANSIMGRGTERVPFVIGYAFPTSIMTISPTCDVRGLAVSGESPGFKAGIFTTMWTDSSVAPTLQQKSFIEAQFFKDFSLT